MQGVPVIVFTLTLLIASASGDKDGTSSAAITGETVEGEENKDVPCPPMSHEDDQ